MNPLASLIAMMVTLKTDLYARFNAAMAKLPPLEGMEAGNAGLAMMHEMEWAKRRIEQVGTDLEATLNAAGTIISGFERKAGESVDLAAARLIECMKADAGTAAISAAIAAKTHLPFEDHKTALDNAVLTAKGEGRTEAETDFNAKLLDLGALATRRADVIARVGLAASIALTDANLLADNHADLLAALEGRIALLTAAGITEAARPKTFPSLLACSLDDAGNAEFTARLEMLTEAAPNGSLSASAVVTPAAPKPTTPAGVLPGNTVARKPVI